MRTTTEFPDTYLSAFLAVPLVVEASGDVFIKLITFTNTGAPISIINITTGDGGSTYFSVWLFGTSIQQFYNMKFTDGLRIVGNAAVLVTGSIMPPQTI